MSVDCHALAKMVEEYAIEAESVDFDRCWSMRKSTVSNVSSSRPSTDGSRVPHSHSLTAACRVFSFWYSVQVEHILLVGGLLLLHVAFACS